MKLIFQLLKQWIEKTFAKKTDIENIKTDIDEEIQDFYTGVMLKDNPVGTGSFSMNRRANSSIGDYSHAEGEDTTASGNHSHVEGYQSVAGGSYSHAECYQSQAIGEYSHAECYNSSAWGKASHAEGDHGEAIGNYSHAEGRYTTASGDYSHAEGGSTQASGDYSHAEGDQTKATGKYSHAEGSRSKATNNYSHAEGFFSIASGVCSHAEGYYTIASDDYSHVGGKWNISDAPFAHIIGNGTSASSRSNAHTLDWNGNAWYAGDVYVGSTDGKNKDSGSKKLATENYVGTQISNHNHDDKYLQSFTETDPTVPAWAKADTKPTYTANEVGALPDTTTIPQQTYFPITEDIVTVTQDATKGVAPYSTSYGMTYIEIDKDAGIEWVEGALYAFIVNTKMVVSSTYRNVAVRIGGDEDGDVWHPLMTTSSIAGGSSYLVKAYNTTWQYKTVYRPEGALHLQTDNNTTYAYLVNTIVGDATASPIKIDDNGYGARYALCFATTPLSDENGIVVDERWSSLVKSSSSGTTKVAVTPKSGKFYIDRHPFYLYSASVAAGAMPINSVYQDYNGTDLRYSANTNSAYLTRSKKVFLWLKNFNGENMSFEADGTIGNIMSLDKISTRFPTTVSGDVYLYFLGWNTATWYSLTPNLTQTQVLFKYTPSTKKFETVKFSSEQAFYVSAEGVAF